MTAVESAESAGRNPHPERFAESRVMRRLCAYMLSKSKRTFRIASIFLTCLIGFVAVLWQGSTYRIEALAPDGKYLARVQACTKFGGFVLPLMGYGSPMVKVQLIERNGGQWTVSRYEQGGIIADWDTPQAIEWSPDGRQFCVVSSHITEPSFQKSEMARLFRSADGQSQQASPTDLASARRALGLSVRIPPH